MTMAPVDINRTKYTHIHFAFGAIDSGTWAINTSQTQHFFDQFIALTGVKRVLSLGGWAFSTDVATYAIFRDAVSDANYEAFADNVVDFVQKHQLDGIDFDWEYPGEQDIPGIPVSSTVDSAGYLRFLQTVRARLPSNMTISVAAPASYWYLQNFPMRNISDTIDYIVFMTYDLHGQWDYRNPWAQDGCPGGSCLRSHVNLTETMSALSMITKAVVPADKIVVGVSSYGRSFKMSTAGCIGPSCTFTGPQSGADPGRCTNTSGLLSNAEIMEILASDKSAKAWYDTESNTDIMTWKDTQWVSYLSNVTVESRKAFYQGMNFGGWAEWAIDLESFAGGNANDTSPPDPPLCDDCPGLDLPDCTGSYGSLDDINNDLGRMRGYCVDTYQINVLSNTLNTAFSNYTSLLKDGYDSKFNTYAKYIRKVVPTYLLNFINAHADQYFSCEVQGQPKLKGCPQLPDLSDWDGTHGGSGSFTFTNETGFYADLAAEYGIDQSWIDVGDYKDRKCAGRVGCAGIYYTGVPQAKSDYEVPDPKDIISAALSNYSALNDMLSEAATNSQSLLYFSTTDDGASTMGDAVEGSALPIFMMQSAIASMDNVVDVAKKAEAELVKEIILGFISGILFLVPFAGEALEGVDVAVVASLGRLISLAGDAGNIAFDVYGTVQDPKNAVFAIFGALSVGRSFGKAAEAVRTLKAADVASLGDTVKSGMAAVDKGVVSCI